MKPKMDSLESKRLRMEIRVESHAAELYEHFCDKELYHYTRRDIPPSSSWLAEGFKKLESLKSPDGSETWLGWVLREKYTGHPVGISELSFFNGEAHIAYTIFRNKWGKGFAAEATSEMMKFARANYEFSRFVIEMDTRNRASIKVAEKLGFKFVKVINNAAFLKNLVSHEFQFEMGRN